MLGHKYRFQVYNDTGQTLAANAVKVRERKWKISSGALVYSADTEVFNNGGTVADNTYDNGPIQDNSSSLDFGAQYSFEVTFPASSAGSVTLYYQQYVDGGTDPPTDGEGRAVAILQHNTSGTKRVMFEIVGDE